MFSQIPEQWKVGCGGDPAIHILLDKATIARIKIKELEAVIHGLQMNLDVAKMTKDALQEQYKKAK